MRNAENLTLAPMMNRLNEARQRVEERLASALAQPGEDTQKSALEGIQALLDTAKDVYTTIGIKAGSELAEQKLRHERQKKRRVTPDVQEPDEAISSEAEAEISAISNHHFLHQEDLQVHHSKDFFAAMESRINLQTLGAFIRDGGTRIQFFEKPFQERYQEATEKLETQVLDLVKDSNAADKIQTAVSEYELTVIDLYFSLGAKAGARLNALLMGGLDKDY